MAAFRLVHRSVILLAALSLLTYPVCAEEWIYDDVERVVAISDIHGAYDAMLRTLRSAAVIDDESAWSGGATHLVIVGDIMDRGPDSRKAMDLLMQLEGEAATAGGNVHVLIGNHEAMNLVGDLRYVSGPEYAAFAAEESPQERERWFVAYVAQRGDGGTTVDAKRQKFDERFPPGFFAHRRAFAADGKYGRWLLSKPEIITIGGTAFVHGGISPMIGKIGIAGVNDKLHGEMATYMRDVETLIDAGLLLPTDGFKEHSELLNFVSTAPANAEKISTTIASVIQLNDSELHAIDGPLWYRGNVYCSEIVEADRLDEALRAIGASRVVVGHTPTPGRRVLSRFGGRVIEIDTGMLNSYYDGRGHALVISGNEITVIGEDGVQLPAPQPHTRSVGARPDQLETRALEKLLRTGKIVTKTTDPTGRITVSVGDGERQVDAVFQRRAGRNFYPEVAAYRLDLLLGFDMVPVAVRRELDGEEGSLRFQPSRAIDEKYRSESGIGGSAWCPLGPQWEAMFVFDALIFNEGRFATNVWYDESTWQLILGGHSKSFSTRKSLPPPPEHVELAVGAAWKRALTALTDELLEERLGDVLDRKRLRALRARRDMLLQE